MSDYCADCNAALPGARLFGDCAKCGNCWAHCWCDDDDPEECRHGTPKVDVCAECKAGHEYVSSIRGRALEEVPDV